MATAFATGAGGRFSQAPQNVAAILLAASVFAQVTALGADNGVLGAGAACLNLVAAGVAVVLLGPPPRFWLYAAPVLALLGAALAWGVLPEMLGGTGIARIDVTMAPRLAADLRDVEITRFFGFAAAILLGALVGYRRGLMRSAIGWLLVFAATNLFVGLVLRQIDPHAVWGVRRVLGGDRFSGTLINANAAACVFGAVALLAAGKWLELRAEAGNAMARAGRFDLSGLAGVLAIASAGACVVSASRTATALVVIGLLLLFAGEGWRARGRQRWIALGLMLGVAVALGLVVAFAGELIQQRLGALGSDAAYRAGIWDRYWLLVGKSPWFGHGLGSFSDLNLHYLRDPAEAAEFWYVNDAHNVLLQLLLEGGWPYLSLLAAAVAIIAMQIVAAGHARRDDALFRAIVLALLLMFGCGLTDIALSVPAVVSFAAVLLGLIWGRGLRTLTDRRETAL